MCEVARHCEREGRKERKCNDENILEGKEIKDRCITIKKG